MSPEQASFALGIGGGAPQPQQQTTSPATPSSPQNPMTPDVLEYAQKHNITPQQALQIKMQRTGGGTQ